MLIAFELSMPGNGSWNGRWSGENKVYAKVIAFRTPPKFFKLGYYSYSFGDGWRAGVTVREVTSAAARKLRKESQGFCGYDWMINSIRCDGDIYGPNRPKPRPQESSEPEHPSGLSGEHDAVLDAIHSESLHGN